MAKINKLTALQEKQLETHREEWLNHGLSTERADFATAEEIISRFYKFMDKPTKEQEEKAVNRPNKIVLPLNKKEIDGVEYELKDEDKISSLLNTFPGLEANK